MSPGSMLKSVVVAACCVVFAGQLCPAQPTNQTPKSLLFRGRPLPFCKSFFVWETGFLVRFGSPRGYTYNNSRERLAATLDIGLMRNLSPAHAIGGLGHLSIDPNTTRLSALVRYRRWLAESPSGSGKRPYRVDIDAGVVVKTLDHVSNYDKSLNLSAGIGLNIEDFFAFTLRYETYRTSQYTYIDYSIPPYIERTMPAKTNGTFYVGVKGGSYIGAGASIVGGAGFLVLLAIFSGMSD